MKAIHGIFYLKGSVKHYDWGGFSFIPTLLAQSNDDNIPYAEYWIGTHPLGKSIIDIPGKPPMLLSEALGPLSYLLKILDVRNMLSIQVHPSKSAAQVEFARENEENIPFDSPVRNYKDDNHKPELMVALSDFWLLHGFKPMEELTDILTNVTELNSLLGTLNRSGYRKLYEKVMTMRQEQVNEMLVPLVDNLLRKYNNNDLDIASEDFWAARAAQKFTGHDIDRGLFSIYLMNLVHLRKGEGIYQGAGLPHAYLQGQNVEIMASSDNVLRGGLTTKHIDVPELMKHITCEPMYPQIILPGAEQGYELYKTEADDFNLSIIRDQKGRVNSRIITRPEIILVTEGQVTIESGEQKLTLGQGHPAALVMPGTIITITQTSPSTIFIASGP